MMHKRNYRRTASAFRLCSRVLALTVLAFAVQGCIVAVGNSRSPGEQQVEQQEPLRETETSLSVSLVAEEAESLRALPNFESQGKEEFDSIVESANRLCSQVPISTVELKRVRKVGESGRVSMTLLIECGALKGSSEDVNEQVEGE